MKNGTYRNRHGKLGLLMEGRWAVRVGDKWSIYSGDFKPQDWEFVSDSLDLSQLLPTPKPDMGDAVVVWRSGDQHWAMDEAGRWSFSDFKWDLPWAIGGPGKPTPYDVLTGRATLLWRNDYTWDGFKWVPPEEERGHDSDEFDWVISPDKPEDADGK